MLKINLKLSSKIFLFRRENIRRINKQTLRKYKSQRKIKIQIIAWEKDLDKVQQLGISWLIMYFWIIKRSKGEENLIKKKKDVRIRIAYVIINFSICLSFF